MTASQSTTSRSDTAASIFRERPLTLDDFKFDEHLLSEKTETYIVHMNNLKK